MSYFLIFEVAISIKGDLVVMELEKRAAMGYCEESNVELFGLVVELCLNIHTHSACAFV